MGTAHGDPSQSKSRQRSLLSPLSFLRSLSPLSVRLLSGVINDAPMSCVFSKFFQPCSSTRTTLFSLCTESQL